MLHTSEPRYRVSGIIPIPILGFMVAAAAGCGAPPGPAHTGSNGRVFLDDGCGADPYPPSTQGPTAGARPNQTFLDPSGPTLSDIQQLWQTLAALPPGGETPNDPSAQIWNYPDGIGGTHTDFYGIEVILPPGTTPEQYILQLQNDPASAANNQPDFTNAVTWPVYTPTPNAPGRPVGDVANLNLGLLAGYGAIEYSHVVTGAPGQLVFGAETISNNTSNNHPVSGRRFWGITAIPNAPNPDTFMVWTSGIDSVNVWGTYTLGGAMAQQSTWLGLMRGVGNYMNANGGQAAQDAVYTGDVAQPTEINPTTAYSCNNPVGARVKGPSGIKNWRACPQKPSGNAPLRSAAAAAAADSGELTPCAPPGSDVVCVDTTSDPQNCGGCGNACSGGQTTCCGRSCVDTTSDSNNCGGCGNACAAGQTCSQSSCVCPQGQTLCGGSCVDTTSDPQNCGGCGNACAVGQTCSNGACADALPCPRPPQWELCNGQCVDLRSDVNNCGRCGHVCPPANSETDVWCSPVSCEESTCTYTDICPQKNCSLCNPCGQGWRAICGGIDECSALCSG